MSISKMDNHFDLFDTHCAVVAGRCCAVAMLKEEYLLVVAKPVSSTSGSIQLAKASVLESARIKTVIKRLPLPPQRTRINNRIIGGRSLWGVSQRNGVATLLHPDSAGFDYWLPPQNRHSRR